MSSPRKGRVGKGRAYALPVIFALMILAWGMGLPRASLAEPGTWSYTGAMSTARSYHTATLLPAGRVLVAGGVNSNPANYLASADLYYPVLGTFSLLAAPMGAARANHTATQLPGGLVLIAGGGNSTSELNTAELFNPLSGTFSSTTGGMAAARSNHTATLLPSGKVLVAGGKHGPGVLALAELYDPGTATWGPTGSMGTARQHHTATLLPNGKVLVVGGDDGTDALPGDALPLPSAELYDPATGTWGLTDPYPLARTLHTATLLLNGKVLVAGGGDFTNTYNSAILYDPATGAWSSTGAMTDAREGHTATLLVNGKVLMAGGARSQLSNPTELYDPVSGTFSPTGSLNANRFFHATTRLTTGKVLVSGGTVGLGLELASAELYEPEPPPVVKLPSLLAFYLFEGNAQDASGNGRHGTINGTLQQVAGYEGQAYYFNGGANYITIPLDINPAQYPRLTMGGWAWIGGNTAIQTVLSQDNGGFDRTLGLDNRGNGNGWSAFCGATAKVLGAVPGIMGSWTFVAVSYDQAAQTVKLQVNDMVLTKTGVTLGQGANQLYIGATPQLNGFFTGAIDNVFVFGDVLTDAQIAYIRNGGAQAIRSAVKGKGTVPILGLLLGD
ncbi:MAG: hypothetical protein NTY36_07335 [Deltaproteobacteria bacterium]|nr:hypothetical protein [Deltaproteobacteria bacterium]